MVPLDELVKIQDLIKNVIFKWCDFRDAFEQSVTGGDFIYADPPYAPENIKSFVGYTKDGFIMDDHIDLFNLLKNSKITFTMSNAKVELVTNNFEGYTIKDVSARRAIHSKNPAALTTEVLVHKSN